ncbi:prolipoprotein diacylglyceryl transferase [Mycobacterium sp.]|uniref:prolipoprotein diacylglyceryl transferase n=1 Tax=Mycobacterium sp. TaxID=1785 RepID=UPI003D0F933A
MRRILFNVRGMPVWSYPALLYLGLVCGFYVMYAVAPEVGLPRAPAADAMLVLFVPAIIGARIWFVLDHWSIYWHDKRRIWRRSDSGMTLYGGLVLALALSPLVIKAFGLRFAAFWDAATFTILAGMTFTRVGCLLNGCCSGRRTGGRFGLWLPDHQGSWQRRYPVQLFELVGALLLLGAAAALLAVGPPRGTIFAFALLGYVAIRLAIDPLRERPTGGGAGRATALAAFVGCSLLAAGLGWFVSR